MLPHPYGLRPLPCAFNNSLKRIAATFLVLVLTLLAAGPARSQSACTAHWGAVDDDGLGGATTVSLRYFNNLTKRWINLNPPALLVGRANAIAGDPANGLLYYFDRSAMRLHSYNLNTRTDTLLGAVGTTGLPVTADNIVGATFTGPGQLFLYATDPAGALGKFVGRVNLSILGSTTWTRVLTAIGADPALGNSGDVYTDKAGNSFIASNTTPSTIWSIDLNPSSASYARTTRTLILNTNLGALAGIAQDPVDGIVYISTGSNNSGAPPGSVTMVLNTVTGSTTLLDTQTVYSLTDSGNCVALPARPTLTKTFSPTYLANSGTATATIAIGNANSVPAWLLATFVDQLPPGMMIANPSNLNPGACASSTTATNTITASIGASTLTFAAGGVIPAGGCTISFSVTANAQANAYTNTLAVGSLSTTAGSNTVAAQATLKVGTDFSVTKVQGTALTGPFTTGSMGINAGGTVVYVITITNSSSGGTGSATFQDTMPSGITPVLSFTTGSTGTGGGTCQFALSAVGNASVITGTASNVIAGAQCRATVTAAVTASAASPSVNTATVAALPSTADTSAANNMATVSASLSTLSTVLTISKTNGTSSVISGGTTAYTITVANLGPADAPGSTLVDPPATGLICTAVSCAVASGVAACPGTVSISGLQGSGLVIPVFNAGSSLTFVVNCQVTATGV